MGNDPKQSVLVDGLTEDLDRGIKVDLRAAWALASHRAPTIFRRMKFSVATKVKWKKNIHYAPEVGGLLALVVP